MREKVHSAQILLSNAACNKNLKVTSKVRRFLTQSKPNILTLACMTVWLAYTSTLCVPVWQKTPVYADRPQSQWKPLARSTQRPWFWQNEP